MNDKLILKVIKGKEYNQVPIWLMRQAGRYLPEYREVRKQFPSFINFCLSPKEAALVTLQPLKRFNLSAAIIFSDILILPYALGQKVEFIEGTGPVLHSIETASQIAGLKLDRNIINNVFEAIKLTKAQITRYHPDTALIGFAGAPWTVACYMVEGRGSKDFAKVRGFAYTHEQEFATLIDILVENSIEYLSGQIEAGADLIKIFDSWAGNLPPDQYKKWVIEPTRKIVNKLKQKYPEIPIIGFAKGSGIMYKKYAEETAVDVVAFDQFTPIEWIKSELSSKNILQGNLDNIILTTEKGLIENAAKHILDSLADTRFIFNLGHGVLPHTPIENVEFLVNLVNNYKK